MTENTEQPDEDNEPDKRLRAFVGPRAEKYHTRWRPMLGAHAHRTSWNWSAALFGGFWLLYRKLYVIAGLLLAIIVVDVNITVELEEAGIAPKAIAAWDRMSYWIYGGVMGIWGNYWYLRKYQKALEAADQQTLAGEEQMAFLRKSGGTNPALAFGLAAVLIGFVVWLVSQEGW